MSQPASRKQRPPSADRRLARNRTAASNEANPQSPERPSDPMRPKHTHSQMRQQTDVSGDLSTESNADTLSSSISAASVSLPQPIGGKSGAHPDAVMSLHRTVTSLRSTKIVRLPESASLFDCCRVMTENRVDAVLLTAEGNESLLKGIITDKDVVRITSISDEYAGLKASGIMTKTPTCATPDTTVQEALKMMVRGHFRHLPVVKDGKIAGLLDITKCLHDAILKMERLIHASSHLYSKLEQKYSEVGQIGFVNSHELVHALKEKMVPTLSTLISSTQQIPEISVQASVRDALKVMAQQKGCATLVTDGNRHVVGIFTAKDLVSRVITPKLDLASTMISKVMTQNPDCANMKTTILDALHLMHDGRFLHLPVMNEQGKVVGLVDVLQLTYRVVSQVREMLCDKDTILLLIQSKNHTLVCLFFQYQIRLLHLLHLVHLLHHVYILLPFISPLFSVVFFSLLPPHTFYTYSSTSNQEEKNSAKSLSETCLVQSCLT
eukprot:TRINITY_DN5419_c0_g2_i5.p1 TRINITY_DN5419_c0_g2~~TRINITY_DN5419_c0_g2_i5.p1  ORF type:complete len:495 (+),score=77.81 TRINITY_DN5419_c0_g2_i5:83-1567(+)